MSASSSSIDPALRRKNEKNDLIRVSARACNHSLSRLSFFLSFFVCLFFFSSSSRTYRLCLSRGALPISSLDALFVLDQFLLLYFVFCFRSVLVDLLLRSNNHCFQKLFQFRFGLFDDFCFVDDLLVIFDLERDFVLQFFLLNNKLMDSLRLHNVGLVRLHPVMNLNKSTHTFKQTNKQSYFFVTLSIAQRFLLASLIRIIIPGRAPLFRVFACCFSRYLKQAKNVSFVFVFSCFSNAHCCHLRTLGFTTAGDALTIFVGRKCGFVSVCLSMCLNIMLWICLFVSRCFWLQLLRKILLRPPTNCVWLITAFVTPLH
jgi:hypothetical protein